MDLAFNAASDYLSPSVRGRGSKLVPAEPVCCTSGVAPRVGAWIETGSQAVDHDDKIERLARWAGDSRRA